MTTPAAQRTALETDDDSWPRPPPAQWATLDLTDALAALALAEQHDDLDSDNVKESEREREGEREQEREASGEEAAMRLLLAQTAAQAPSPSTSALRCALALRLGDLAVALRALADLHAAAPRAPLAHDGALYDAIFAVAERAHGSSHVRMLALGTGSAAVAAQHAAYVAAKLARGRESVQQQLTLEAARNVQRRHITWLDRWLAQQLSRAAFRPISVNLRLLPWQPLSQLTIPNAWLPRIEVAAEEVATWLVRSELCPPDSEDDGRGLTRLLRALDVERGSDQRPAGRRPDSLLRTVLTRFVDALKARVDQLLMRRDHHPLDPGRLAEAQLPEATAEAAASKDEDCEEWLLLAARVSAVQGSQRGLLALTPRFISFSSTASSVFDAPALSSAIVRISWQDVSVVENFELTVLFTVLPCLRIRTGHNKVLEVSFANDAARSLASLAAHELWAAHALLRDLQDAQPLRRASIAVVVAQALADVLPTKQSHFSPRPLTARSRPTAPSLIHSGPTISAAYFALQGSILDRSEQRLAVRIQGRGILNHPESVHTGSSVHRRRAPTAIDPDEDAGDSMNAVVVELLVKAVQLLYAHSEASPTPRLSPDSVIREASRMNSVSVPAIRLSNDGSPESAVAGSTRKRSGSAGSASEMGWVLVSPPEGLPHVDWERLRASKEYELFSLGTMSLADHFVDPAGLSPQQRTAILINVYNLLTLHACFELGSVPLSLLEWRLMSRFSCYTIGGLPYTLDLIHRLLRGSAAVNGCVADLDVHPEDPRSQWMLPSLDPRVHFALCTLHASSPPRTIATAYNLESLLDRAAEDYCARHVRLESSARLVVPALFAWYRPDFDRGLTESDSASGLGSILRWLSEERRGEVARVVEEAHFELAYEFDWSIQPRPPP